MVFEEFGNRFIEIPKYENCFVYFLIKNEEVVYVGQTQVGLSRPLHHKDKDYDKIVIYYCDCDKLDETEDYFITKYDPKYNKLQNTKIWCGKDKVKKMVHQATGNTKFNAWDLKRIIKILNISMFRNTINIKDANKIVEFAKEVY